MRVEHVLDHFEGADFVLFRFGFFELGDFFGGERLAEVVERFAEADREGLIERAAGPSRSSLYQAQ